MKKENTIARIENSLIFDAEYQLTAKEQKVILFLASYVDPLKKTGFDSQIISLKTLESVLISDSKNGSFYKEAGRFAGRIIKKGISFSSDFELNGERLPGYINWFQSIVPCRNEDGEVSLRFKFSEDLKPFFLELREYVQINYLEVLPLKSGYSVRLFQIFRAYRNRVSKHQLRSTKYYELGELKRLLGLRGKYPVYTNFKKRILIPAEREINKLTGIGLKFRPKKQGRNVVGIEFEFWDKDNRAKESSSSFSTSKGFDALTFAQVKAYDILVAYGVNESIVFEMLSKCQGSETKGFEDWYMNEVISIFESKTNQDNKAAKAGTLVNWYLKKKVFEQGDMFAKIMEVLQARKKKLQKDAPQSWDNRLLAREMTAEAFRKKVKT